MNTAKPLDGKAALVTGGNKGLGAAIVADLARQGANVVLAARSVALGEALVAGLAECAGQLAVVACDVAERGAAARAVAATVAEFCALDILVNNAGQIDPIGHFLDTDAETWEQAFTVNLFGAQRMLRAALPQLIARGGTLVNISSGAAHSPREGWSAYCSSKAALAMLTRSTALEYAPRGVRSYGFQPGVVDTDMQVAIRASGMNEISRLGREQLAAPGVPARWVTWLCAERPQDLDGRDFSVNDAALKARVAQWQDG